MNYSISNDIESGQLNISKLGNEISLSSIIIGTKFIRSYGDTLEIEFKANISTLDEQTLDGIVFYHNGAATPIAKITTLAGHDYDNLDYRSLDYVLTPSSNLFPKRFFVKGELQKVEWYSDSIFTDLVLQADMTYTRDVFGFAVSRTTVRTWMDESGSPLPETKITEKNYSSNPMSQIEEGKKRRSNIVNGIQIPTMGLMIESMSGDPYNYSQGQILLTGRDFLDRHESEFKNFIESSSSVTDFNDPNFGRKKVAVAIELAAITSDTWLKETPSQLGGASIEQYLVNEFTI